MSKKLFLFLTCILLSQLIFSQSIELSGKVEDTTSKLSVKNAVVALLSSGDSVLRKFIRTGDNGEFRFRNMKNGNYILMVMHPLFADYVDNIEIKDVSREMGAIPVTSKSKLLAAVIIQSGSPIRIKGDTTIYTADSFKVSANANVEELLKKLPGIQVDKDGKIKAMGETVEKVLVDGEEFFGDDPGMAVKNLRADAVKEVQVFDKKSDQAEFTGIDDGNTKKTINLKLKENKKTGYFGKISISGGLQKHIDDRYNNNLMFSTFKGKRKLSAFLLNGNTGQDGLSWQDNEKYGGESDNYSMSMDEDGGMMWMSRGGGSDEEPEVNTENGYIKNVNAGLQYSNKWNDKTTLNLSPKFTSQIYSNNKIIYTQTPGFDELKNKNVLQNNNATEQTDVNRYYFKLRGTYDIKFDSVNSLKLTLGTNFYHTESEMIKKGITTDDETGDLKNTSDRNTRTKSDKTALSANLIFKHKFKKARRTLSVTGDWNSLSTVGKNYLRSHNQTYNVINPVTVDLDQMKDNDKSTQKILSKAIYTEPLGKKFAMEIGYEFSYSKGRNNQVTYSYSPATGKYDVLVDTLTNDFDQAITTHKPSFKLNYADKKIKFNFGSGFGLTHFDLVDNSFNKDYIRNYTNFFPSASLNYAYKSSRNLRIYYNGNTNQPTISQLQPLRNNTDFFNQAIGNPDLKPSFSNNFGISHNSYDFIKDRWLYQSINFTQTSNAITNNRIINFNTGQIFNKPINTNGNFSVNIYAGGGGKIKKIDTRIYINPNFGYSKFADVINGIVSYTHNYNTGLSVYLQKAKDKKYDISLSNEFNYNNNKTSQASSNMHYYTNTVSTDITIYFHKVWSINTDFQYNIRQKTAQFPNNLNTQLWNARFQKTFKNNEFTAFIKVRDILNQNTGIERSFEGNILKQEQNDRLKRYWLVGFSWDFKNKASKGAK